MSAFIRLLPFALLLWAATAAATTEETLSLPDGTDLSYAVYAAEGRDLVIWVPSEAGLQVSEQATSEALSAAGVEVWIPDLVASRFLPYVQSSQDLIPAGDVAGLLDAGRATGKRVFLVAVGRGAIPALRGARAWQESAGGEATLAGAILLHPKFYTETPDPGVPARVLPIVEATNLPLFLIQPEKSPWRWRLHETVPALERGGSSVYVQYLPGVRDRFFFRPDADEAERALGDTLPAMIAQAMRLLGPFGEQPRRAVALAAEAPEVKAGKGGRALVPYAGNPVPAPLRLADLDGRVHDLADYRGRAVLVNFWAGWCPPCVHEMPSMQRLKEHFAGRPFEILAVNMAESEAAVREFLATKVKVDFTILMDRHGAALQAWDVFAFPTSFVIDKDGRIRYALYGAIEWDGEEVVGQIEGLL